MRLLSYTKPEDYPAISGADDDQLPALECIPAIVASQRAGQGRSRDDLICTVPQAVAVTHDHPQARDAATVAAIALDEVLTGTPLPQALSQAAQAAGDVVRVDGVSSGLEVSPPGASQILSGWDKQGFLRCVVGGA